MTYGKRLFIKLLRDHINGVPSVVNGDIDIPWDEIQVYSKAHQTEGIIYYQTRNERFFTSFSSSLYLYSNRKSALEKIANEFKKSFVIVKGLEVAKLYPLPALRTMGDIDIVVASENKNELHELMLKEGYVCNQSDREWHYYKGNIMFEVHDRLVYSAQRKTDSQEQFFNDFWKYRSGYGLDWNFHFLFLVFHLRKHFLNQGVGFRQFLDIAVVSKRCEKLDWSWIENRLKEIDMFKFATIVFSLCNRWFDTEIPITCNLDDTFVEETTNIVFKNGVFGFGDSNNQKNVVVNQIRNKGKTGMMYRFISDVFLPLGRMKKLSGYSFLNDRSYLLPFAWLNRLLKKTRTRNFGILRTHYFITNKEINEREEYLNKWGIK